MSSQIDIANRALTKLGAARITALTDNTNGAKVINSMWDIIRDAELRAHVWRFATVRIALAALGSTPAFGYTYQYQLPADCLRVLEVSEHYEVSGLSDYITTNDQPYTLEGNLLLTNYVAPLKIRYVSRIEDTNQYDPVFVEALACKLAIECADALTNSIEKKQVLFQEYKSVLVDAIKANALEAPPRSIYDNSWMISRL